MEFSHSLVDDIKRGELYVRVQDNEETRMGEVKGVSVENSSRISIPMLRNNIKTYNEKQYICVDVEIDGITTEYDIREVERVPKLEKKVMEVLNECDNK